MWKHHVNLLLQSFRSVSSDLHQYYYTSIISTDEDPSLRIESSAIINLRGVSTKLNKYNANLTLWKHHVNLLLQSFRSVSSDGIFISASNKQLLNEVFVICRIINVEVRVISRAEGEADNSYRDIDNHPCNSLHPANTSQP